VDHYTRPAKLTASKESNEKIVEELYLLAYNRFPTAAERKTALASLPAKAIAAKPSKICR
jgi:hypothetical protein